MSQQKKEKKKLDRLQVAAFKATFKARLPGATPEMAFAQAIALTSDECFEKALKERPSLVKKWLRDFSS